MKVSRPAAISSGEMPSAQALATAVADVALRTGKKVPVLYTSSTQAARENPYGQSKQDFDLWVLETAKRPSDCPPLWAGFKFFNVYGPNEYHKGRMASVVFHTVRQIKATGGMKLFRSHRPDFKDGEQSRDFIYVKDVVAVLQWFLEKRPANGIFNLGTGKARSFRDLAEATFRALDLEPNITFIDTPEDIRDTYQYYTQADLLRLRATGYHEPFYGLEEGVADYVQRYLRTETTW